MVEASARDRPRAGQVSPVRALNPANAESSRRGNVTPEHGKCVLVPPWYVRHCGILYSRKTGGATAAACRACWVAAMAEALRRLRQLPFRARWQLAAGATTHTCRCRCLPLVGVGASASASASARAVRVRWRTPGTHARRPEAFAGARPAPHGSAAEAGALEGEPRAAPGSGQRRRRRAHQEHGPEAPLLGRERERRQQPERRACGSPKLSGHAPVSARTTEPDLLAHLAGCSVDVAVATYNCLAKASLSTANPLVELAAQRVLQVSSDIHGPELKALVSGIPPLGHRANRGDRVCSRTACMARDPPSLLPAPRVPCPSFPPLSLLLLPSFPLLTPTYSHRHLCTTSLCAPSPLRPCAACPAALRRSAAHGTRQLHAGN